MFAHPVHEQQSYEVSAFLNIKPKVIAVLELLMALVIVGIMMWNENSLLLVSPLFLILTGTVMIIAAGTHNLCLVRTSHAFSCLNMVVAVVSFFIHLSHLSFVMHTDGTWIVLVLCDAVAFICSIIVMSTCCASCCRPKARRAAVSYMSTPLPVNNVVLLGQSDPTASPQHVGSVMYFLPAGHVPCAPPHYNSLVPTDYSSVPAAPPHYNSLVPTDYSSVPAAPPPAYDQVSVFSPLDLRIRQQSDQSHQHVK